MAVLEMAGMAGTGVMGPRRARARAAMAAMVWVPWVLPAAVPTTKAGTMRALTMAVPPGSGLVLPAAAAPVAAIPVVLRGLWAPVLAVAALVAMVVVAAMAAVGSSAVATAEAAGAAQVLAEVLARV